MCAISAVYDYFGRQPGLMPYIGPPIPRQPTPTWTRETLDEFKEIIRRLDALDTKLGQPECEDPSKAAWVAEVEKRLAALEAAAP